MSDTKLEQVNSDLTQEQQDVVLQAVNEQEDAAKAVVASQSNEMGRPTVVTESVVRNLIACFQRGLTDKTACETAGIGRTAYYDAIKNNEEFANRIAQAKNFVKLLASKRMIEVLQDGADRDAVPLIKFALERKEPDEYGARPSTVVNNNIQYVPPTWFTEKPEDKK